VSSITPELIRNCRRCSRELAPGALVCDDCHALVHAQELEQISAEAKTLEASGDLHQARDKWRSSLLLLPRNSKQADWVKQHANDLELKAIAHEVPENDNRWAKKLGPAGPIAILLLKGKAVLAAIFKLKFLASFFSFLFIYSALYGAKFGIGFALLILIHEMGHFIDIKRRGLPAEMPVFLPGFGAYVRWQALGVSLETRAAVSLAGPLAGGLASLACALMWWHSGDHLWAALARSSAALNLLNLIPVWALDGGQAAAALDRTGRLIILSACLLLWLFLGENLYFLVAVGAGYRLFTKDLPPYPSRTTTIYFVALLGGLGLLLSYLPGQGFATR
jgi:Zn-dependent protease